MSDETTRWQSPYAAWRRPFWPISLAFVIACFVCAALILIGAPAVLGYLMVAASFAWIAIVQLSTARTRRKRRQTT